MTISEVIEKAAQLGGWMILADGRIRRATLSAYECPVTAVANATAGRGYYNVGQYMLAAGAIGLSGPDCDLLACAADHDLPDSEVKELRKLMLAKFGFRVD